MSSNDKFQKVWNFAEPPQTFFLPNTGGEAEQGGGINLTVTFSFSALHNMEDAGGFPANVRDLNDMPMIYSNTDTGLILDTATSLSTFFYKWVPPEPMIVVGTFTRMSAAVNVTTYVAGNIDLESLRIQFGSGFVAGGLFTEVYSDITIPSAGNSRLTGTGTNLCTFNYYDPTTYAVSPSKPLNFALGLNVLDTVGGNTFKLGPVALAPMVANVSVKPFLLSMTKILAIPDTDANRYILDYRGSDFK